MKLKEDLSLRNQSYSIKQNYSLTKLWSEDLVRIGKLTPILQIGILLRIPTLHPQLEKCNDDLA